MNLSVLPKYGERLQYGIDADELIVSVACNEKAMKYWALQYGEYAEILEPKSLRDEIRKAVRDMGKIYGEDV